MPTLPKNKKQLNVYINENVLETIREMAKTDNKGRMYGLSNLVEQALGSWIAHRKAQERQQIPTLNPSPKAFNLITQIKEHLREKEGFLPQQVTIYQLRDAISIFRGHDERTIRSWLKQLTKFKCIKEMTGNIYEIP